MNGNSDAAIGAKMVNFGANINICWDASPYILTEIIREARNLCQNCTQAFLLFSGGIIAISLNVLLSLLLFQQPGLFSFEIVVICFIMLPLLSGMLLFSPYEENILKSMPSNNTKSFPEWPIYLFYFVCRISPSFLALFAFWNESSVAFHISLILFLLVSSVSCLHRNSSLLKYPPIFNIPFAVVSFLL